MTTSHASRRAFLKHALLAGGAAALPSSAWAIEPIARSHGPKFKFSLAAYSYRDYFSGKIQPKLTLDDFVDDCAKLGLEGTELTSYYFPATVKDDELLSIKHRAFELGLDVSGTAIGNELCHPPGAKRDEQLKHVRAWIDRAAVLGAPVIRIFSGSNQGQSKEEAHRLAVDGMEQSCEYAGTKGVMLALENHGGLTSQADEMLELVRAVKSPWFGVNLDTGNFHGQDVYADLAKLAPYAVNVQVKVVVSGSDGKRQPSDFKRLAAILRDSGYRGYIVLEYEEKDDPRKACAGFLADLRSAFA